MKPVPRRCWAALLAALCGLTAAADGDEAPAWSFGGFGWAALSARQLRIDSNPDNGARVPETVAEGAAVLDGRRGRFSFRLRAEASTRRVPGSANEREQRDTRLDLTQLVFVQPLAGDWSLTAARMNLSFDEGQSFHPMDFLEDTVRGTDFEDRAGRNRGFPLLMLARTSAGSGLRLLYSDDALTDDAYRFGDPNPNFNRGHRQAILSWRQSLGSLTATALVQRSWPGRTGAGFSFSWVPDAAWSVYGSVFAAPGNVLPMHRNVYLGRASGFNASDVYINTSPMQAWAAGDDRWRTRWLLGASWTAEGGTTLTAELWRDGRGMDAAQWRTWQALFAFHEGLANAVARRVNTGFDLEALRTPSRAQLFLRAKLPLPEPLGSLQVSNLLAQDGSGSLAARWTLSPTPDWEVAAELWRRHGAQLSQYGLVPDRTGLMLSARRFF